MKAALYKTPQGIIGDLGEIQSVPYFLTPNVPNEVIALTAPGLAAGPIPMTAPFDGPLILRSLYANITNLATTFVDFSIQDGTEERQLQNAPIYLPTIVGTYERPYYLPQFLFIPENGVLNASFGSTAAFTDLRLCFGAAKLLRRTLDQSGKLALDRIQRRSILSIPYFMTFQNGSLSLGALGSGTGEMQVSNEGTFLLRKISYMSTSTLNFNIRNESTGESLFVAPANQTYEVPIQTVVGQFGTPLDLIEPWLIGPGQKLIVNATDTSNGANTLYLTLSGEFIRNGDMR